MQKPPKLDEGEEVLLCVPGQLGDVVRSNAIVALTHKRIFSQVKRGRSVSKEFNDRVGFEVSIAEIERIRKHGVFNVELEIVTAETVYKPPLIERTAANKFVEYISSIRGMEKADYGQDSLSVSTTKKAISLVAMAIGVLSLIGSAILVIAGFLLIISIMGIILGIILLLSGSTLGAFGYYILKWSGTFGFDAKSEWVASAGDGQTIPQDIDSEKSSNVDSLEITTQEAENSVMQRLEMGSEKLSIGANRSLSNLSPAARLSPFWPFGVLIGCLLWLSGFGFAILEYEGALGAVTILAWILLPLSIYFDSKNVRKSDEWNPRWWAYLVLSVIPIFGMIFGFAWMYRRRKFTGSTFGVPTISGSSLP